MGFAGVDLPENFDEAAETSPSAGAETPPKSLDGTKGSETPGTPTKQEMLDLDKHDRFRWQGRDWDRKELERGVLMQSDYTRKTQELAEARKYADNFDADLSKVLDDHALLDEMRKIYPAPYVNLAERIIERTNQLMGHTASAGASGQAGTPQDVQKLVQSMLSKELGPIKEKFSQTEQKEREIETQKLELWLDKTYEKYQTKYPSANPALVDSRCLAAHDSGTKITEGVIEKLFKASHDEAENWYVTRSKRQVADQKQANAKARDAGAGGGVPGGAPQKRTLKEARKAMLEEIEASA